VRFKLGKPHRKQKRKLDTEVAVVLTQEMEGDRVKTVSGSVSSPTVIESQQGRIAECKFKAYRNRRVTKIEN
jgi:hypothetical protein